MAAQQPIHATLLMMGTQGPWSQAQIHLEHHLLDDEEGYRCSARASKVLDRAWIPVHDASRALQGQGLKQDLAIV